MLSYHAPVLVSLIFPGKQQNLDSGTERFPLVPMVSYYKVPYIQRKEENKRSKSSLGVEQVYIQMSKQYSLEMAHLSQQFLYSY